MGWKMGNGRGKIEPACRQAWDGRWKMGDGRWKMEDGRWKMEDGRGNLPAVRHGREDGRGNLPAVRHGMEAALRLVEDFTN